MEATRVIDPTRLRRLNDADAGRGAYVLYWMQQSQRAEHNHALEFAAQRANALGTPLVVGFGLTDDYPDANLRHYHFMLEGLTEVRSSLARRGIAFVLRRGDPAEVALTLGRDAAVIVCDRGYLRHQRRWRHRVADAAPCEVVEVEADVVVPVEAASDKAEHAARTLRPKLHRQLDRYLVGLRTTPLDHDALGLELETLDVDNRDALLATRAIDRSVKPVARFPGGTGAAKRRLRTFLDKSLPVYAAHRNQPHTDDVTYLSMALHFGQLSPVQAALEVRAAADDDDENAAALLEELIVRRELACNFVYHTPDYDRYTCIPAWARQTLVRHRRDKREHVYTPAEFEAAQTHDPYWNAAMREMLHTGYMHNHMRMYWGKQILAWSASPEAAYRTALTLNNRYFLDGRDPASYANVAWLFGVHDRPWPERAVFGKVRSMTAAGLARKADPDAYVAKVDRLVADAARG